MKPEDIEEIVQTAEQANSNFIKNQFAESFNKLNKKRSFEFNGSMIGLIVIVIVLLAGTWIQVSTLNDIKDNADSNTAAIINNQNEGFNTLESNSAGLYDAIAEGTNTVTTKLDETTKAVEESNNKVIAEQRKTTEAVQNVARKVTASMLRNHRRCMRQAALELTEQNGGFSINELSAKCGYLLK